MDRDGAVLRIHGGGVLNSLHHHPMRLGHFLVQRPQLPLLRMEPEFRHPPKQDAQFRSGIRAREHHHRLDPRQIPRPARPDHPRQIPLNDQTTLTVPHQRHLRVPGHLHIEEGRHIVGDHVVIGNGAQRMQPDAGTGIGHVEQIAAHPERGILADAGIDVGPGRLRREQAVHQHHREIGHGRLPLIEPTVDSADNTPLTAPRRGNGCDACRFTSPPQKSDPSVGDRAFARNRG
nr:hypothetical protein [Nocardia terpenica]